MVKSNMVQENIKLAADVMELRLALVFARHSFKLLSELPLTLFQKSTVEYAIKAIDNTLDAAALSQKGE